MTRNLTQKNIDDMSMQIAQEKTHIGDLEKTLRTKEDEAAAMVLQIETLVQERMQAANAATEKREKLEKEMQEAAAQLADMKRPGYLERRKAALTEEVSALTLEVKKLNEERDVVLRNMEYLRTVYVQQRATKREKSVDHDLILSGGVKRSVGDTGETILAKRAEQRKKPTSGMYPKTPRKGTE